MGLQRDQTGRQLRRDLRQASRLRLAAQARARLQQFVDQGRADLRDADPLSSGASEMRSQYPRPPLPQIRLGRAWPGHPRLDTTVASQTKAWMAGPNPAQAAFMRQNFAGNPRRSRQSIFPGPLPALAGMMGA